MGDVLVYNTSSCRAVYLKKKFIDIVVYDEIYGKLIDKETVGQLVSFGTAQEENNIKSGGGIIVP